VQEDGNQLTWGHVCRRSSIVRFTPGCDPILNALFLRGPFHGGVGHVSPIGKAKVCRRFTHGARLVSESKCYQSSGRLSAVYGEAVDVSECRLADCSTVVLWVMCHSST
jgi:hypothetical protein